MYSYGDSTAFPLRENFLDTLMSTVRACTALFAIECELTTSDAKVREARSAAEIEFARLDSLQDELVKTLTGAEGAPSSQAAQILSQAAAKVLGQTRTRIHASRDQAIAKATPRNLNARVRRILTSFWLTNELPHTRWRFRWRIDKDGEARTYLCASSKGVSVDFRTQIGGNEIWSAPVLVSSLMPNLAIEVPIWTRRCKGTQTKEESLDDYQIIEVDSSASRQRFVLRRSGKAKHALMITLADAAQSAPTVALIDEQHDVMGDSHRLSVNEVERLGKLWNLLLEHSPSLLQSRSELAKVTIGNRNIETITRPSEIAEELLQIVAPLVREIRLRSRVPGELILKRNTGKGRREEIFISRESIQQQYQSLPERYQRIFDAMGLGNESTCDFMTMLGSQLKAKGRPRSSRVVSTLAEAMDADLEAVLLEIEAA